MASLSVFLFANRCASQRLGILCTLKLSPVPVSGADEQENGMKMQEAREKTTGSPFQRISSPALAMIAILASLGSIIIGSYGAETILYNPEAGFFWFFSGVILKLPHLEGKKSLLGESAR